MSGFYNLGDFLKDINFQKKNLIRIDPTAKKDYPKFVINRILGGFLDTLLHVNQLNIREFADEGMQYDYLIHATTKRKRFNKKLDVNIDNNIETVMKYYNYNREKAIEVVSLFDDDKINEMKKTMNKGGK